MHSWSSSSASSSSTSSGSRRAALRLQHALIQEVAYESLLSVRRRAVHAAAARALEALHRGRLEQVYDRLADHWYRAEEAEPAVEFLSRFAAQAASAYAHVEASEALRKALAQVGRLPENMRTRAAASSSCWRARSLYFMGRFHESIALLSEHEHEASGLADPDLTAPIASGWPTRRATSGRTSGGGAARAGGARRG